MVTVSPVTILAFVLLGAGVLWSLYPRVPGALASLTGVYLYWWSTGYTEPTWPLVLAITILGALAIFGTLFEDVVAARMGGASGFSATVAGVVGIVVFVFVGPLAMLAATALTVFVLEYRRQQDLRAGVSAALAVVFAAIASRIVKFLFTTLILLVMIVVVVT